MTSDKNKVIIVGPLAFDYIMTFNDNFINSIIMNRENGEFYSNIAVINRYLCFGGTAGNISYNLGQLNIGNVQLISSVGKDFESLGYKDHLCSFNNIELEVKIHNDSLTATCFIVNDININQIIIFHGGAMDKCEEIDLREKINNHVKNKKKAIL